MDPSKHKRPLESSTSSGEGGQRHSKRPAPSTSDLENHGPQSSSGIHWVRSPFFEEEIDIPNLFSDAPSEDTLLENVDMQDPPGNRQVVQEEREQANIKLIKLIDSRIQNANERLITQIDSLLKNAVQELVRREEWKQANSDLEKFIDSHFQKASKEISLIKKAIRKPVCKGMDHANPHSFKPVQSTLPKSTQITDTRNMQLHFTSSLCLPLFTGVPLKVQDGPIQIKLIDANTGMVVTSGPESSAKLDVVVLKGDFNRDDCDTWSVTEFEQYMVKEREGRGPLLTGKLQVKLKEGIGELGNLKFTDNSSWTGSKKFRIGVRVASGFCKGIQVREAITEAFAVKEHRGIAYEKHNEPASDDEIWRLEKIARGGEYCKRLNKEGIGTVEEFVRHLVGDSKKLRNILGKGMPDKKWNALINHANKCVPDGKSYVYYCDEKNGYGVVISNICQLNGLIARRVYQTADELSDRQKAHADNLVKEASKNWNLVREFSPEYFSGPMTSQSLSGCLVELPMNFKSSVPVSRGLTVGLPNVNHNRSVGVTPQSSNIAHDKSLNSLVTEQDARQCNQQVILPNENTPCTEPHEFSNWLINSPPLCFTEDPLLSSAYDCLGGDILSNNVYVILCASQKIFQRFPEVWVDPLVQKAYENWAHVIQYDGESLLNVKENSNIGPAHSEFSLGPQDYSSSFDRQLHFPSLSVSVPAEQPTMDSGQGGGGYGDGMGTGFLMQSENVNLTNPIHFDSTLFSTQNALMSSPNHPQVMQTESVPPVGPSQSASSVLHAAGPSNLNPHRDVNESFLEEEIRVHSHEMLVNEYTQHLLRLLSFSDDRGQSSGKAVVWWLKLKAAFRWGIFIRKKAAERRARLVELDDT